MDDGAQTKKERNLEHTTEDNVKTQMSCLEHKQHTDTLSLLASNVFATGLQQI